MPPLATKSLVMIDVIYSLDEATIKQTIRFLIGLERTTLKAKLNLRLKLWNGLGPPVIDVSVKKDSLLVYVLNLFGILVCRCGSVVVSRASDRSRKKKANFAGFLGTNSRKNRRFRGNFWGQTSTKSYRQKTVDFVVMFKANFPRNRSVLR